MDGTKRSTADTHICVAMSTGRRLCDSHGMPLLFIYTLHQSPSNKEKCRFSKQKIVKQDSFLWPFDANSQEKSCLANGTLANSSWTASTVGVDYIVKGSTSWLLMTETSEITSSFSFLYPRHKRKKTCILFRFTSSRPSTWQPNVKQNGQQLGDRNVDKNLLCTTQQVDDYGHYSRLVCLLDSALFFFIGHLLFCHWLLLAVVLL